MASFVSDFLDCMSTSVSVQTVSGRNAFGEASLSTDASTYTARVVDEHSELRSDRGLIGFVTTVVWIASTSATFDGTEIVTLPGGETPPILRVQTFRDENGITHSKLMMGERIGEQQVHGTERLS